MKKSAAFILFLSLVAAAFAGLLLVPRFIDWGRYAPQIQDKVAELTGYELVLGDAFGVGLLPAPHVYAEDVRILVPDHYGEDALLTLDELEVYLDLLPLLRGELSFQAVDLDAPVLVLKTDAQGNPLWLSDKMASGGKGNGAGGGGGADISLDHARIRNGQVIYVDGKSGGRKTLDKLSADIKAPSLQGPFDVQGSFVYEGQTATLQAKSGVLNAQDQVIPLSVQAALKPLGVDINYAGAVASDGAQGELNMVISSSVPVAGRDLKGGALKALMRADKDEVTLDDLRFELGKDKLEGRIYASLPARKMTADLAGSLPDIGAVNLSGDVLWGEILRLQNGRVKLGETALQLDGSYDARPDRPILKVDASANTLDVAKFTGAGKHKQEKAEPPVAALMGALQLLSLPMDVVFDLGAQKLLVADYDIAGARLNGAVGANNINISNLSVQDIKGLKVKAQGGVADLKKFSGLTFKLEAQGDNVPASAQALGVDTQSWPKQITRGLARIEAQGDLSGVAFKGQVQALGGDVALSGQSGGLLGGFDVRNLHVDLKHPDFMQALRIFAADMPEFPAWHKPLVFAADIDAANKVYKLSNINGTLMGASSAGAAILDLSGVKPSLSGELAFGDLDLRQVKAKKSSAGASQAGPKGVKSTNGRWSTAPLDLGWMDAFDADLAIKAKGLKYAQWDFQEPALRFMLKNGVLDVPTLKAALFGGQADMSAQLKKADVPALVIKSQMNGVGMEPLLRALSGSNLLQGQGEVDLAMDLKTSGTSQRALVGALHGSATLKGGALTLRGFDVTQFAAALSGETKAGDTLLGLWDSAAKGGSTAFDTLDGIFAVQDGVVDITRLDLDGAQALVETTGNVKLIPWTIDTAHKFTLKGRDDVPPFTVNVSGSLDNPAQTFGQGALHDYLTRKINRKLEKLLMDKLGVPETQSDTTSSGGTSPAPQQKQLTPEDAFRGLLEGLIQ